MYSGPVANKWGYFESKLVNAQSTLYNWSRFDVLSIRHTVDHRILRVIFIYVTAVPVLSLSSEMTTNPLLSTT